MKAGDWLKLTHRQGPLRYDVNIFSHSEMTEYKKPLKRRLKFQFVCKSLVKYKTFSLLQFQFGTILKCIQKIKLLSKSKEEHTNKLINRITLDFMYSL